MFTIGCRLSQDSHRLVPICNRKLLGNANLGRGTGALTPCYNFHRYFVAFVLLIVAYLVTVIVYDPILHLSRQTLPGLILFIHTAMYVIVQIDILGKDYCSSFLVIPLAPVSVTVIYHGFSTII